MKKTTLLFILFISPFVFGQVNSLHDYDKSLRQEICLNGIWEIKVDGDSEFVKIQVPGSFTGQDDLWGKRHWDVWGYPKKWKNKAAVYRRLISIPKNIKGKRTLIRFEGVRHVGRIEINSKEVGKWNDSYIPFEFDITDYIHSGTNEMTVFVEDKNTSGLFEDYNAKRRGIYRDVFLKFVPDVHVDSEIYMQTSVAENNVTYQVPVINNSLKKQEINIRFKIKNAKGKVIKTWDYKEKICLAPSETKTITTTQAWDNAHFWSIDDPYLYFVITEVLNKKGDLLDAHKLRFGFREITWKKNHLYLNGNELFIRGHGGHSLGDLQGGKNYSEAWIKQLKEQGVEAMRLHNMPRHAEIYEAADEMGFLLISEAAHHFRLPSKEQALSHMESLVKWLRNHPSIIMWSVANELHWRNFEEPAYLIELSRQLDPSRPAFNSDFTKWSKHGDVISHHYDAENIWNDWEEYGPEKVMIWDEIGNVWQHDRPLKTGPAGVEISSQDVATGTWRDGWEMMRKDIEVFADGKMIDNEFFRVNAYFPWELSYNFYRFQPINNFQRYYPKYDYTEGARGIKPKFINPSATPINIWDPTLPSHIANPALYCFNEFLARVRFPDDKKYKTYFSGEMIQQGGRLFFEDHRPADQVEFRVETANGKVLSSVVKDISLKAGAYLTSFISQWELPVVDTLTQVKLVRQFSNKSIVGYRKISEAKIFPRFKTVNLNTQKIAVVGKPLQKLLGGAGVSISSAKIIVAESYDESWENTISDGARLLIQPIEKKTTTQNKLSHSIITIRGGEKQYLGAIDSLKISETHSMSFGTPGKELSNMNSKSFTIQQPLPGAWVTFDFAGTINFGRSSLMQLDYGLWKNPGKEGYKKAWADNGGAPFYQKTIKILLSDTSGYWFVSGEDEVGVMTREHPTAFNDMLRFDCSKFSWKPIKFEGGKVVAIDDKIQINLTEVASIGVLFTESNPGSQVQIKSIDIKGGALPAAYVQPGSNHHELVNNLGQEDFSFWRGGSSIKSRALPESQNVRRILFGNKDGSGSALQEVFIGKGIVLESTLNIQNTEEPVAGFLLNRMLDYLNSYEPSKKLGKVSLIGHGFFDDWFKKMGVYITSKTSNSDLIVVEVKDVNALAKRKNNLIKHLRSGGTILFSQVNPESIDLVREITGKKLRLTDPFFGQYFKCIKAPISWKRIGSRHEWVDYYDGVLVPYPFEPNLNPLLSGIANIDLDWNQTEMFRYGIEIENMNPVYAAEEQQILISNWHIGSESTNHLYGEQLNGVRDLRQNSWFVNRDAVVLEMNAQGGRVIISQLDLKLGGEKAHRIIQTLLTNLGVSFNGAYPIATENVYDMTVQKSQVARFEIYNKQIDPVKREYYGVPNPMPDYLKGTKVTAIVEELELPTLLFLGDELTLGIHYPLLTTLEGVVKMLDPIGLGKSTEAAELISKKIGKTRFDRVVFSIGENDLDTDIADKDFLQNLEVIWKVLDKKSSKIYWLPIPSAFGKDKNRAVIAQRFNKIAAQFFEKKDVYSIPFVYKDVAGLPVGYFAGRTNEFSPNEAKALAKLLADAITSFGAQ